MIEHSYWIYRQIGRLQNITIFQTKHDDRQIYALLKTDQSEGLQRHGLRTFFTQRCFRTSCEGDRKVSSPSAGPLRRLT